MSSLVRGSAHEWQLENSCCAVACADSKFNMVISSLEGLTDVLKKGFADVAAVKDHMERILPKLANQAAGMDSSSKEKHNKVKVRPRSLYTIVPIQQRLCMRRYVTHVALPFICHVCSAARFQAMSAASVLLPY